MTALSPSGPLVDGKLVETPHTITVVNPATGEACAECPAATPELLERAVDAAVRAAPAWAKEPGARRWTLETVATVLDENREALARTLSTETGIPVRDAAMEAAGAAAFARHRAAGPLPVDSVHDDERQRVQVRRAPIGVVGAIIPWNAPLLISAEKISTAFATGNTVIVKPSPLAPLTTALLGELLAQSVPSGVLGVLPGGDELGAALVAHPAVGMISFTGSIDAGRAIMAAAAPRLKRLSLELGGNDAAIVLPDVSGGAVAKTAAKVYAGAFYRSGQVCAAIKRLYLPRPVFGEFTEALAALAGQAVVGDPFDPSVTMGPVSNRAQSDRVRGLVEDAVAAGGTVLAGGPEVSGPGYFHRPTLVTGLAADTALVAQEQFGPALPVLPYDEVDEAVAAANDTDYGLGASVWTTDPERGAEVAASLDAGSVWVNRHGVVSPEIPFGGMKQSGYGRANGAAGLDQYSELKTVSVRR
ncbi:aldehyde dehydrogenase family protein [Pseudonocardia eucalypti]|uniref:Aldehyde dehydrogenase family protein n=1 Tax=Pseudonocardia eucalypti TaxID=648755 RepID=A0ABP9QGW4_9PSEU|nr:acyl-CoA reductase-like NAD-dependent aldehyde dehydrogenase [Pseudonocardia eucalypti]